MKNTILMIPHKQLIKGKNFKRPFFGKTIQSIELTKLNQSYQMMA